MSAGPNKEAEEQQPEVIISDVDPPGPKAENKEQEKGNEIVSPSWRLNTLRLCLPFLNFKIDLRKL